MQVKSMTVTDYSTGTSYSYGGTAGTWQSIVANGGTVNPKGGSGSGSPPAAAPAPAVTSASPSMPYPFEGTHKDTSSAFSTPNVYPWVAGPSTLETAVAKATSLPGLPAGWTVSDSGKAIPPSSAPVSKPCLTPRPSARGRSWERSLTLASSSQLPLSRRHRRHRRSHLPRHPVKW